jgi:beta propeller repeat protein
MNKNHRNSSSGLLLSHDSRAEFFYETRLYRHLIGLLLIAALLSSNASALSGHEILIHSPNITADEKSPDFYEYSGFFNLDDSNLVWMNTWAERKIDNKRVQNRIYLLNLSDNSTVLISEGPGTSHENVFRPPISLSGRTVVWSEFGRNDLFQYDTLHGVEERLTFDGSASDQQWENTAPHVDGDRVVWSKKKPFTSSYDQDIVLQNLTTGILRNISTGNGNQFDPSISGPRIVWTDKRNEPTGGDIYLFDLETEIETPICTESGLQQKPEIFGDIVIWQDYRNGKPEVYLRNIVSGTESRISRDFFSADEPFLSGKFAVWMEYSDLDRRDERAGAIVVYNTVSGIREILPVKSSHPQLLTAHENRVLYADPNDRSLEEGFVHLFIIDNSIIPPVSTTNSLSRLNLEDANPITTPVSEQTPTHPAPASMVTIPFSIGVLVLLYRFQIQRRKKNTRNQALFPKFCEESAQYP